MTGSEIRTQREEHNITQRELAQAIGIPPTTLSGIETNDREVEEDLATRINAYFDSVRQSEQSETEPTDELPPGEPGNSETKNEDAQAAPPTEIEPEPVREHPYDPFEFGLVLHEDEYTMLIALGEADPISGAYHEYVVIPREKLPETPESIDQLRELAIETVNLQKGPRKEVGVNSLTDEDLARILVHRMKGFQSGRFPSRYTEIGGSHFATGLNWLEDRKRDRELRGVEGTNQA